MHCKFIVLNHCFFSIGRSWWRKGTGLFSKMFSTFSGVPAFFLSAYSKQITAKKWKMLTHAMYTLDQHLVPLFGWLTCSSPCAGRLKVSLGTWLFSCSLWESHERRRLFCLQFFNWTAENEPSPDSFKHNCTFLHKDAVCLEGDNRAVCLPEILGTHVHVGFGFFPHRYWRGYIASRPRQEPTLRTRSKWGGTEPESHVIEMWK